MFAVYIVRAASKLSYFTKKEKKKMKKKKKDI